jgi:hypothetical protein
MVIDTIGGVGVTFLAFAGVIALGALYVFVKGSVGAKK